MALASCRACGSFRNSTPYNPCGSYLRPWLLHMCPWGISRCNKELVKEIGVSPPNLKTKNPRKMRITSSIPLACYLNYGQNHSTCIISIIIPLTLRRFEVVFAAVPLLSLFAMFS